jgi:hypothetical protein
MTVVERVSDHAQLIGKLAVGATVVALSVDAVQTWPVTTACAVLMGLWVSASAVGDGEDLDDRALAEARSAYIEDDISLEEFEREAELALDGRAVEIRGVVATADGVGEAISASVAMEFDTIEDVEAASTDELMQVNGVGEVKAEDIQDAIA